MASYEQMQTIKKWSILKKKSNFKPKKVVNIHLTGLISKCDAEHISILFGSFVENNPWFDSSWDPTICIFEQTEKISNNR